MLGRMESVIRVEGLVKKFGETTALAGVDLVARPGAVLGLLGRGGSGKTTTVRARHCCSGRSSPISPAT